MRRRATANPACESSAAKTVRPAMPSGIKPYSIFPPDKNPAAKLPMPMPMDSEICSQPLCVSSKCKMSLP